MRQPERVSLAPSNEKGKFGHQEAQSPKSPKSHLIAKKGVVAMSMIITIKEISKIYKVSESTLYEMAQDGVLPAFKLGRLWRARASAIQKFFGKNLGKYLETGKYS